MYMAAKEKDFASSDATKGLSDRPLETFGCHLLEQEYNHAAIAAAHLVIYYFCVALNSSSCLLISAMY